MFHDIFFGKFPRCDVRQGGQKNMFKNIMQSIIKIYTSVVSFLDTQAVSAAAKRLGAQSVATVLIII